MQIYVVCHRGYEGGYLTHSYIEAMNFEEAQQEAVKRFNNIISVMQLNK